MSPERCREEEELQIPGATGIRRGPGSTRECFWQQHKTGAAEALGWAAGGESVQIGVILGKLG